MSQVATTKNSNFVATIDLVAGCIYKQIIPKFASKSVWIRQTLGILASLFVNNAGLAYFSVENDRIVSNL